MDSKKLKIIIDIVTVLDAHTCSGFETSQNESNTWESNKKTMMRIGVKMMLGAST